MASEREEERLIRFRSATKFWPDGVKGIPYLPQPPAPLEYPCSECGTTFSRETQRKFHLRNHVNPRWPHKFTLDCLVCSLKFENSSQLGRHYALKHKGENPPSGVGGAAVDRKKKIEKIKSNGTGGGCRGGMRWKCPKCENVYTASTSLKEHLLDKHLGIRRFRCKFCLRRFAKKYNKEQHVLTMH